MRSHLVIAALSILFASAASAEQRTFIVANNPDGYGVDRCLAKGENCGNLVAGAYCRSQAFADVVSFRKVERDEITGAVPTQKDVCRGTCDEFVAITCSR